MNPRTARTSVALAALALAGCATFSPDGGRGDVQALAADRLGAPARVLAQRDDEAARRDAVAARLAAPLDADAAVEVALLNQPALAAKLAELGVAEADLVQAGRLRNPVFAYSNKRNADVQSIERTLMVNLASIVLMPLALDLERKRFEQAKVASALAVLVAAADVRQAYYRAVAAQEMLAYHRQVKLAAEASSELARRMREVGNFSRLAQMREHAFYADATAQLARAEVVALAEREKLARLMGVADARSFTLPARLPDPPAAPLAVSDAEQAAMDRRLDVRLAALETAAVADALGLVKSTRFINLLEVGYTNESETGEARKNGYEIELEVPLFDFGDARVARAEARYRQALARTAGVAVSARSDVREAHAAYRTAWELARHYRDEIVPLRRAISEEQLLRYNGMLIGVFDLLADAREQIGSVNAAIAATRDYWLASSALELALTGTSPGAPLAFAAEPAAAAAPGAGH